MTQINSNSKGLIGYVLKNRVTIAASVISFVVGLFGQMTVERYKHNLEQEKILIDQRTTLWKSATDHFAQYINNWERVRTIYLDRIDAKVRNDMPKCSIELNMIKLSKDVQARKERYIQDRDKEKDLLAADLEEARFIYANTAVPTEIEKFDKFREVNKSKDACTLPDISELRKIEWGILISMLTEMPKSIERK